MEEVQYRISPRQLQRMILLETGSIGCLFVTAWTGVQNGLLIVMLSIIGSLIYGGLLMAIGRTDGGYFAITERSLHGFLWRLVWLVYILRFAIRGAWILSYMEYLIRETLYEGSRLMIILPLLLICAYAGMRSLEGRARFVELLFWWVIIPLVLLFLTGLWKVDLGSLSPEPDVNIRQVLRGEYQLMALFLPLEFLLFRMSAMEGGDRKAWNVGMRGILSAGMWLLLVYVVTVGILGVHWGHRSLLGVTEAMELISIKGGGLERIDILMILIWLVGGIITLSAYLFQGQQLLRRIIPRQNRVVPAAVGMTLLILAIYFCFPDVQAWTEWYWRYACRIDFPVSVILPVVIWCIYRIRSRKKQMQIMTDHLEPPVKEFAKPLLLLCLCVGTAAGLSGCGAQTSIEDRTYVESLHITSDHDKYQYRCTIAYMDEKSAENLGMGDVGTGSEMNEKSGSRQEGAGEYSALAEGIDAFNQEYYRKTGNSFDYSHLQGIYLDPGLYQPVRAEHILKDIREETQAVLSTPIYQEGVGTGEQKEETLGEWLKAGGE